MIIKFLLLGTLIIYAVILTFYYIAEKPTDGYYAIKGYFP